MKKTLRVISLFLAAVFVLTALCGCGLFGKNKIKMPDKQTVDHVYKYEETKLYTAKEPDYSDTENFNGYTSIRSNAVGAGGYAFVLEDRDKNYNTTALTLHMKAFGAADEVTVSLKVPTVSEESGEQTYWSNISGLTVLDDGVLLMTEENTLIDPDTYAYESATTFSFYNFDGSLRATVDPRKAFDVPGEVYLSLQNVQVYEGDLFMRVYAEDARYNSGSIYRVGMDGTIKGAYEFLAPEAEGDLNSFYFLGNGKLCAGVETYGANYTQKLVTMDMATGEKTETVVKDYNILYSGFADGNGSLYYADNNSIWKLDPATGAKTECMNFINSDYIYQYGTFRATDEEHFFSMTMKWGEEDSTSTLLLTTFEKVPDDQLTPKYLITVASSGYAYDFQEQIVQFNLASDEYRIKYVDYMQYNTSDDYEAGAKKLQSDIIAGNVPDILLANSEFSASNYVNKGLFADLYTFIDNDPDLKRSDFLSNILKGCEIGGKLYELPTHVYLFGLMGKKEFISEYDGITLREFCEKVKKLPEGVSFFREGDSNREDLLRQFFFINYVNFIDPATGRCSRNNDDFKAMLEYVATIPEKSMWEDIDYDTFDWEEYDNRYKENKAIAQAADLRSFTQFEQYGYTFGNAELDFIGFPSPDGDGMVFTTSNLKFLISEKSQVRDAAWDFVKIFFEEDYQTSAGWAFPVTVKALDIQKQKALDYIKERENGTDEGIATPRERVVATTGVVSDMIYEDPDTRETTAEDVERIYGYVTSAHKQLIYDEDIFDIVTENASAYFAGQKSLDQVASLIESSINIKISESR